MKDIVPELLERIQIDFEKKTSQDKAVGIFQEKISKGKATLHELSLYGRILGDYLAEVLLSCITPDTLPESTFYFNIADRILDAALHHNYNLINEAAAQVQKAIDEADGIGLKAVKAPYPQERVMALVNGLADKTAGWETIRRRMDEPVRNICQSFVDDFIRANADFRSRTGMPTYIVRQTAGKCCDWCKNLTGTYAYPENVPDDVFRRHDNCKCTVVYKSDKGTQDVWTKKWKDPTETAKIEVRKQVGLNAEDDAIQNHIRENVIPKQNTERIVERQQIHRKGTRLYERHRIILQNKGQYGPSYVTITDDEILELIQTYSGKGYIKYDRKGKWNSQEVILTNDKMIGVVVNNRNGASAETTVFKIHYSKDGIHIVPDYPSKKR